MAFGVGILNFSIGMGDGGHNAMIRAATDSFLGHAQIQPEGYLDEPGLEKSIPPETLARLLDQVPRVEGVEGLAPRIVTGGLLSLKVPEPEDENDMAAWEKMTSEGAAVIGIRPDLERKVSTLEKSLMADDPEARCLRGCSSALSEIYAQDDRCGALCESLGSPLTQDTCANVGQMVCHGQCRPQDELCDEADCTDRFADYCEPARFLSISDPYPDNPYMAEAVLGAGLAKVLGASVGDRVALTSGTAKGRSFASLDSVVGLVKTGSIDINRTFVIVDMDKLATGLDMPGAASVAVLALTNLDEAEEGAEAVRLAVSESLAGLRVLPWNELSPELEVFIQFDQGSMIVMLMMFIMIVGVILANVVTMSVMERTREYGVRLAMGESPNRVVAGLLMESLLMSLLFGAIGSGLGTALNAYFGVHGIDFGMGEMETTGVVVDTIWYCEVSLYGFILSWGTVLFFAMAGSLYPALRIYRIRPVDALRFV